MSRWNYGDKYKLYDMEGEIKIGKGIVKVHDIYEEIPKFMRQADCIFVDPPCSLGNLNTFYTKADRNDYKNDYLTFVERLFYYIDEINPSYLYIEVFKSNKDIILDNCKKRFKFVGIDESTYYHNNKNKCWIIYCSNKEVKHPNEKLDEEDYIKWICENVDYKCIADPCIGRGLVGYYSQLNNKNFVGTELNKKRLAVLVDKITKMTNDSRKENK